LSVTLTNQALDRLFENILAEAGMITLNIQLKFDLDDPEKELPNVKELTRITARALYTGMLLISTRRKPKIAITCTDFFMGSEEINVMEGADEHPDTE
jgi:hypothetical protein